MWYPEDPVDLGLSASLYGGFFMLFPPLDLLGLLAEVEVNWAFWGPTGAEGRGIVILLPFVIRPEVAVPRPGGD